MGSASLRMRLASLAVCAIITLNTCPVRASGDFSRVIRNYRTPEDDHNHGHHSAHELHDHSNPGEHTTEVIFLGKHYGEESVRKAEQSHNREAGDFIHEYERHDDKERLHDLEIRLSSISGNTWMASFCSIGIISFVGLLTVGIIPMLKGPHQETALQLLVSLAVGTLVGDALIHLLPHALQAEHGDTDVVWKGFTATLTIITFFVMDRVLEGLGHGHSHGPGHNHHHDGSSHGGDTENLTVSTRTSRESTPVSKTKSMSSLYSHSLYQRDSSYQSLTRDSCCQMPSSSLMVIVGDAIHNFADGLAVGAAFSMSLAAGFSTSIAVLCHELPHEVGDFALLLHSGMSVKVAILYNCVSSIFAFIGLVVGLLLGTHGGFSSWLLAGTVGVFLYVALVSMLTELKGGDWSNIALNTLGMVCGAVLLLIIGLYEHDLILLFEEEGEHSH